MDKRPVKEEVKKPPATPRSGTSRASAPTISSQRATGNTINKPPTRPTASSARRDAASKDEEKEKRPSSRTTTTPATTRRTTLGGATTSAPPKRPPVTSRARPTSPEKTRTTAASTSQASTKSPATESTKSSTASAVRPFSRDTIPEEPAENARPALLPAPSFASSSTDAPALGSRSPPKLEIRSTPVLKPQAESDAEAERRTKSIVRHARTQSNVSMPAIGQTVDGSRELQALQSMLREKAARGVLEDEKKVLKAEVARLQQQNTTLTEAAHRNTESGSSAEKAREAVAKELEQVKVAHRAALQALESTHKTELETLHAELKKLRRKSSEFTNVTSKIRDVEEALRESRARASQNEEELQQTIQEKVADRDQLANIIEELKSEIDKAQFKLDADVAKQAQEKKKAIAQMEGVQKELAEERRRNKEVLDGVEKEKRETVERVEREVESLRQTAADAEKSARELQEELNGVRQQHSEDSAQRQGESETVVGELKAEMERVIAAHSTELEQARKDTVDHETTAKDLRSELEALRRSHQTESEKSQQDSKDDLEKLRSQHIGALEKSNKSAEDAETSANELRSELDALRRDHTTQKEDSEQLNKANLDKLLIKHTKELEQAKKQAQDTETIANELRSELEALRREHETAHELNQSSQKIIEELRENKRKLEQEGTDGSNVVKDLQTQLQEAQQLKTDTQEKYEGEMRDLRVVIENLQTESVKLQQVHEEALAQKSEEAEELEAVTEDLRNKILEHQQAAEDARASAEKESTGVIDGLRKELESAREQLSDELRVLESDRNDLRQKYEEMQAATDTLTKTIEAQKTELLEKDEEMEEMSDANMCRVDMLEDVHAKQLEELKASRDSAEEAQRTQLRKELEDAQSRAQEAEGAKSEAESALARLRQETDHLQQSHDELVTEYSDYKSGGEVSAKARNEEQAAALKEKDEQIQKLLANVEDVERIKSDSRKALSDVQAEMATLVEETDTLKEVFASAQRDAVERETQLRKDFEDAHVAKVQSRQAAHAQELDGLKSSGVSAEEVQQLSTEKDSLERHLGDLEIRHNRELEEEAQKHEGAYRDLQNAFAQLKESMSEQSQRQKHQLHESSVAHDDALAALTEGHKEAIEKLAAEHSKALEEARSQHQTVLETPKTPTPSNGLNHVFVNHDGARGNSSGRRLSETPLAYASEDDAILSSPTPAYPRDGNRAGAIQHVRQPSLQDHRILEAENAKLVAALKAVEAELEVLKRTSSPEDPFASPRSKRAITNGAVNQMSLEGTLESLRIQTEQLLEVQDDVLAENWRFRQRLQRVV